MSRVYDFEGEMKISKLLLTLLGSVWLVFSSLYVLGSQLVIVAIKGEFLPSLVVADSLDRFIANYKSNVS